MPTYITEDGPLEHLIMPKLARGDSEVFPVADKVVDVTDLCPDNNGRYAQIVLKLGDFEAEPVFQLQKRNRPGEDLGPGHDQSLSLQTLAEMTEAGHYTDDLSLTAIELGHTPDNLASIVLSVSMLR